MPCLLLQTDPVPNYQRIKRAGTSAPPFFAATFYPVLYTGKKQPHLKTAARLKKMVICFKKIAIRFRKMAFRFKKMAVRFKKIAFRFKKMVVRFKKIAFRLKKMVIRFKKTGKFFKRAPPSPCLRTSPRQQGHCFQIYRVGCLQGLIQELYR